MRIFTRISLFFTLCTLLLSQRAMASHAMGADLTYNCIGPNQFLIRLSFYRDCAGITPSTSFNVSVTSASCGQTLNITANQLAGYPVEVSPLCAAQLSQSTCNGGTLPGVQQYVYEGIVNLPAACTDWVFSIREGNRNSTITTISAPGSAWLYVEATLNNVAAPCNSSPDFTSVPVPYICAGQSYIYNHGAVDIDGDSLVYTLINALDNAGVPVTYNGGFSGANPMTSTPAVTINSLNGNVTMNPVGTQIAVVAVRVDEYRNGVLIGSTIRDIQVTVLNCTNNSPVINALTGVTGGTQVGPYSIEVCPGQTVSFNIPGSDPDGGQNITWSWNNGIPGGVFTGPSGGSPQTATFSWTPTAADIGLNSLTVNLVDNGCPVLGSQTRAIDIRVLQGTTAGPDQSYCTAGGPVQLQAIGGTSFTWTILSGTAGSLSCTNCSNPLATPSVPTTYIVQSNLSGLCRNRDTVVVTPVPNFTLTMGPTQTLCLGGSTVLSAAPTPAGTYTYVWSPGTNLSSTSVTSPTANPSVTTTYNVTVTSAAGCRVTGAQTVNVSNQILSTAPAASPTQSCAGSPVTLNSNVSTGSCTQYTVASITNNPVGGGGWTNVSLSDDQLSAAIPIGFNFTFFCNTYTNAYISSNAFISFDATAGAGCCSGQNIPNTSTPNNAIFVHHEDYAGNTPRYKTIGTAPNRQFIVHYNGAAHLSGGGTPLDAQIILYETSNNVEIHITNAGTDGTGETEGIENSAGTIAYTVAGRNAVAWSATNSAHRFAPIVPLPYTVNWQAPLGNTVGTGNTLAVTPSTTTTYYAVVNNGVCTAQAPVTVNVVNVSAGPDINICPAGQNVPLNAVYTGPPPVSNCNVYSVASIPFAPGTAGGTSLTLGDDQISAAIPIGFPFTFYCNVYNNVYASSNGFITFNAASGSGCCSGTTLPTTTITDFIAATWNDLYPPAGGTIQYQTTGTAPNRVFNIYYTGINHCCSAGAINTFVIKLYETTNYIEIHNTTITDDGSTHTQGIQGLSGTPVVVPGRDGSNFTATNDAYRFMPQVIPVTYTWSPATYLTSTTVSNPTANSVASAITYTVTVNNGTCVVSDDVSIIICLPVDQLELQGKAVGDKVLLDWTSFNEVNVDRYVIERSGDAQTWTDLGAESAVGQPGMDAEYASQDPAPLVGMNYYRLRVVDNDGRTAYSNQVEVMFTGKDWVKLSPNPGRGQYMFEVSQVTAGDVRIEIYDAGGRLVHSQRNPEMPAGLNRFEADITRFPAGSYMYRVYTRTGDMQGKLVKID